MFACLRNLFASDSPVEVLVAKGTETVWLRDGKIVKRFVLPEHVPITGGEFLVKGSTAIVRGASACDWMVFPASALLGRKNGEIYNVKVTQR